VSDDEKAPELWERQPGETTRAFAGFVAYRDLGPTRTQGDVPQLTGESLERVYKWSTHWRWAERASAWDDHCDETMRAAELDELEEMGRRHARLGVAMLEQVQRSLDLMRADDEKPLSVKLLARWAKIGVEIERLARGAATAHVMTSEARESDAFEELLKNPETRAHLIAAAARPTRMADAPSSDGGGVEPRSVADGAPPRDPVE